MKELIFGLTDKINTPYYYESVLIESHAFESIDITYKPYTTHMFLILNGCEILDDDSETGLDFSYMDVGINTLPDHTPRFLDFEGNETEHDYIFFILILSGVLNETV